MGKTSTPVMMRQDLFPVVALCRVFFYFVDKGSGGADVKALGLAGKDTWCSLVAESDHANDSIQ